MFVNYEKDSMKVPIKVWLEDPAQLEESCKKQAYRLSTLPFLHKWVCLMPDTHAGMGMPIGGVIATEDVIIPNAVGVDIGCGMAYTQTNVPVSLLRGIQTGNGTLLQAMVGDIMRNIPLGFAPPSVPIWKYPASSWPKSSASSSYRSSSSMARSSV